MVEMERQNVFDTWTVVENITSQRRILITGRRICYAAGSVANKAAPPDSIPEASTEHQFDFQSSD